MAKITLHSDNQISATSVSNIFIDEYMSDANGEFVKIYLYLLRLMNAPDAAFSISSIADKFEHTEKDIKRALCYWERMHLLRLEYDDKKNLTGICLLDSVSRKTPPSAGSATEPEATAETVSVFEEVIVTTPTMDAVTAPVSDKASTKANEAETMTKTTKAKAAMDKKSYSKDDIKQFRQNDSIAELFFITERYLGHPLNDTDVQIILHLYDGLGFSTDLIEYLIETCVSSGHKSLRYIEKVALSWKENNITTVEEAKLADSVHTKTYYTVMKSFGISGRNLIPSETKLLKKWTTEYGFSEELISEACQRTVQAVHQPSFAYADSILTNWHKKQVRSLSDLSAIDAEHQNKKKSTATSNTTSTTSKNKFNNFSQRSYDYDQLEKMLLTTTVQ